MRHGMVRTKEKKGREGIINNNRNRSRRKNERKIYCCEQMILRKQKNRKGKRSKQTNLDVEWINK